MLKGRLAHKARAARRGIKVRKDQAERRGRKDLRAILVCKDRQVLRDNLVSQERRGRKASPDLKAMSVQPGQPPLLVSGWLLAKARSRVSPTKLLFRWYARVVPQMGRGAPHPRPRSQVYVSSSDAGCVTSGLPYHR